MTVANFLAEANGVEMDCYFIFEDRKVNLNCTGDEGFDCGFGRVNFICDEIVDNSEGDTHLFSFYNKGKCVLDLYQPCSSVSEDEVENDLTGETELLYTMEFEHTPVTIYFSL